MMMSKSVLVVALCCALAAACVNADLQVERVMLPGPFMPPHPPMGPPAHPHPGMPEFTETIFRPGMAHPMTIHGFGHPPLPLPMAPPLGPAPGMFPGHHPMVTFHLLGHPAPMVMHPMGHPMMHALFFAPPSANPLQFLSPEYHLVHTLPAAFQPPPAPPAATQPAPAHDNTSSEQLHTFPHPFAIFGSTKGPFGNFFGHLAHDLAKPMAKVRSFERHAEDGLARGFGHMLEGARRFEDKLARAVNKHDNDNNDDDDEHASSSSFSSSSTVQEEATDTNGVVHGFIKKTHDEKQPGHAPVHTESVTPIGQSAVAGDDEGDNDDTDDDSKANDPVDDRDDDEDADEDEDEDEDEQAQHTQQAQQAQQAPTTSTVHKTAPVHKTATPTTTTKVVEDKADTEAAIARAVADIRAHNHGKP